MQSAPSNKIYAQALSKIEKLVNRYSSLKDRSPDKIAMEISNALVEINQDLNKPLLDYEEFEFGEVPDSFKMNKILSDLASDINIIIDESDIIRSATVQTHNFIKTEILKSEEENTHLHNKIKTLQLYSNNEDSSILYLGDYFYNDDYIDWDLVPVDKRVELKKGDRITLGIESQQSALSAQANVSVLLGSNGFIGNNQELKSGIVGNNPDSANNNGLVFLSEEDRSSPFDQLDNIIDSQPDTLFEFEKYFINPKEKAKAGNFNFTYQASDNSQLSYLTPLLGEGREVDWADGLQDGKLKLFLLVDIGSISKVDIINFLPYGLRNNANAPILIKKVSLSIDQTDWFPLSRQNVFVANGIDQNSVKLNSEDIVINLASFQAEGVEARFILFEIEQGTPYKTNAGHFYYLEDQGDGDVEQQVRVQGPVPEVANLWREKAPNSLYQNNLLQKREAISADRWAIGIRDISIYSTKYKQTSTLVSKKFLVPGGVDRVSIESNITIPSSYPTDTAWIRFYISPDDGNTWHQISRIQDDFFGIPEIIAYNDNTPINLRIPGVKYYDTISTPNSLRVKIEIDQQFSDNTLSPVVNDYRIKVKQRNSL